MSEFWEAEVRALFMRGGLEVEEFEALLDVALRGGQPKHPDLPLFAPPSRPRPDRLARTRL